MKKRPALVISSDAYNDACPDLIIAMITSKVNSPPRPGDHRLNDWRGAGLLMPSLVRAKVTTLESGIVMKALGRMPPKEMAAIDASFAPVLGLA